MFQAPIPTGGTVAADGWKSLQRAVLAPDRLRRLADVDVEPTPYQEVYAENKVRLRHYEADGPDRRDVPVVIAYAFVNSPAILDLQADRSVVGQFLDRGFDVYVVDWGHPSRLDCHLTLADYVTRYLRNCVDVARSRADADGVHLLGYSTGGPLAAVYGALFPDDVRTLTLMGPPIDFHVDAGFLDFRELVGTPDPDTVVASMGNVPAEVMDATFSLRKPVDLPVYLPIWVWEHLEDEAFVEHFGRRARWAADGPDLAGATYRQFVVDLFRENRLIRNTLELGRRRVDLTEIDVPLLLILGRDDAYVPRESALAVLDVVSSHDTAVLEFPAGHVGLSLDREVHEAWWPRVCDWLVERSIRDG